MGLFVLSVFNAASQTPQSIGATGKSGTASAAAKTAPVKLAQATSAGPSWLQLTVSQQQALRPLQSKWDSLPERQKRKWLALVPNYHARPATEQAKLHSRMTEWAALSTQQREQARLNFAEAAGSVSAQERKAKWEAYQALSPEEKKKLAPHALTKPAGAATAVKPVPPEKLADVAPSKPGGHGSRAVKSNTLGAATNAPSTARPVASPPALVAVPAAGVNEGSSAPVAEPAAALAPTGSVQAN